MPPNTEATHIAPTDLTAILKAPVTYDWSREIGKEGYNADVVYDASWVGREIRHFPWSAELFKAEDELLKPNGYHIPKSWEPIVNGIVRRLGLKVTGKPYQQNDGADKISLDLRESLGVMLSGYINVHTIEDRFYNEEKLSRLENVDGWGSFWSTAKSESPGGAYSLFFNTVMVNPKAHDRRSHALSVRCVSTVEPESNK